ncbi:hypothetical protein CJF31_00001298 [Rutstroemia sp. NJR-2017a BVV2]|nr:hypothetical protein CJF31_00001298 [Rutstroemia sp. NJR-2017a BVV2]
MISDEESTNFQVFRDCISAPLIEKSTSKTAKPKRKANGRRKTAIKPVSQPADDINDAAELADFVEYIATEIFTSLPPELRTLSYTTYINSRDLPTRYPVPLEFETSSVILNAIDPGIGDSLSTYDLLPSNKTITEFLHPILSAYVSHFTNPSPEPSSLRQSVTECELCGRSWIPLTYHHLIPKFVHAKVLKRGWHTEDQLNNVAWLCRACHSFVHRIASHEELARDYYTVELLEEREDVRAFADWVGRVRWKAR